jgi:RNA polymerase sigma factor for flagellar operon FliA
MLDVAPVPADPDADEEAALWAALRAGSASARGELFDRNLSYARALARKEYRSRRGADIDPDDLFQLACTGLLEAMDRFDPSLGVPFRGFANRRIRGAMIDGIAKMSEVREQLSHRGRVKRERLRSLTGERAANMGSADAMEALVDMAVGLALGFMLEGTGLYHDEEAASVQATAYDSLAWREMIDRLVAELDRLPERDRTILRLHYMEDVNFDQIAVLQGLSKGRISQLHKAALMLLRKRMSGAGGFRLER